MKTTIAQVGKYVDKEVTIGAWIANKRSSGKIAFFYSFVMEQVLFKELLSKQRLMKKFLRQRKRLRKKAHCTLLESFVQTTVHHSVMN